MRYDLNPGLNLGLSATMLANDNDGDPRREDTPPEAPSHEEVPTTPQKHDEPPPKMAN